jgi:site-specific recombinase XerD
MANSTSTGAMLDDPRTVIPVHARGDSSVSARPRRPKPRTRRPAEVLTDAEVRALMAACGDGSIGDRHRALLAVMYRAGLRISEALALRPHDVDLQNGTIRVRFAKGGGDRVVGLDPGAGAVVAAWVERRAALRLPAGSVLFCTSSGRAITTAYIRRLLPCLGRAAGIDKRVHAHGLRHTHAAQLRSEGVEIGIISRQLGHRSILTTIRYLDHLNPTAVIDAMRKRAW